jgi:hypothetical protein
MGDQLFYILMAPIVFVIIILFLLLNLFTLYSIIDNQFRFSVNSSECCSYVKGNHKKYDIVYARAHADGQTKRAV